MTGEHRKGKRESMREVSEFKKRDEGDKIGREQTIVIKLSMMSGQSCRALIRFNHL